VSTLDSTITSTDISQEIRDFDRREERRRRIVPRAALVGGLARLLGIVPERKAEIFPG
jgi:hypothetical protein